MDGAGYRLYGDGGRRRPLAFRADTRKLRAWLSRRKSSLEAARAEFEPLWRELRLHFEPNLGKALLSDAARDAAAAMREDAKIVNSEPRLCVERYAAGMQSGITNKAQQWCTIVAKGLDDAEARRPDVNAWCAHATSEVLAALERGNFYRTTQQVYPHGALFGTSCALALRGDAPGEVSFHVVDEGDYWIAEDRYGEVTTLMRRASLTLEQAREEFLSANMPEAWRRKIADGRLEERVTVWNLICPNAGGEGFEDVAPEMAYASFYWLPEGAGCASDGVLDVRGFTYRPMAVLRQSVAGSAYGKGIGEKTLADCRELQELEECELRMVANESTPAVLAPSSMKGRAINMFPGGVTYYDGMLGGGAAPVTRLFETREGIDKVEMKIQAVTDRIRRFWYNDLFAMMLTVSQGGRTHRTATEVSELAGEKVTLLGPVLTQMDDFLTAAVDATLTILMEDGVVPPPPDALARSGGAVSVEYTSTIHAEMKAALRMRAINSLVEMTSMLAQASPETLDKMDSDAIVDEVSRTYPGAAAFVRDAKAVAAIRAERQDAQAEREREARTVEMMKNAGANAKALSEAKTGNGSALELLMAGGAA